MVDYNMLKLSDTFNAKLMTTHKDKAACMAALGSCGFQNQDWHMFQADSMPESNQIIQINDVPFNFPDKKYDKYDAISCESQIVNFREDVYTDLYLLGAAFDFCEGLEVIQLFGENGETLQEEVFFADWYFAKANTTWSYDAIHKKECVPGIMGIHLSDLSKRCIYFMHMKINSQGYVLNSIEFPLNPDMYIFAATLGKEISS